MACVLLDPAVDQHSVLVLHPCALSRDLQDGLSEQLEALKRGETSCFWLIRIHIPVSLSTNVIGNIWAFDGLGYAVAGTHVNFAQE